MPVHAQSHPAQVSNILIEKIQVCIATDARFPGGSSSSTAEELTANNALGIDTRFYQCFSSMLRNANIAFNPKLQHVFQSHPEKLIWPVRDPRPSRCQVLFFRHPSVVHKHSTFPPLRPDQIIVIINHPMRNAMGRQDFNLTMVKALLEREYEVTPRFLAISPIIRASYDEAQKRLIDETVYWYNFFQPARSIVSPEQRFERQQARKFLTIGRHSRDGREKWPATSAEIKAIYPNARDIAVRVLGGTTTVESTLGRLPENWTSFPFGSRRVDDFLEEIDLFIYFHHARWIEAFGRVIAEAMSVGIPTILPAYLSPLYGEAAICCAPRTSSM